MKEFFSQYGFAAIMLLVCLGSHFFMHRGGGHGGHGGQGGHCKPGNQHNTNSKEVENGSQVDGKN